jgi:hypothetical protein
MKVRHQTACGMIHPGESLETLLHLVPPNSKVHRLPDALPAIVSPTPGLRQARRKRLESRLGQDGTLYQEGRKQTDLWLPDKPVYLRIFLDIPGQNERVKHNEPLGKCSTREEARRKADRWIMTNGINDREKLESVVQSGETTFRSQAAWWLSELGSGRLKSRQKNKRGQKIRITTLDAYTSAVAYLNELSTLPRQSPALGLFVHSRHLAKYSEYALMYDT